jgi:hypothetical protein
MLVVTPTAPDRFPRPTVAPVKTAVRRVLVVTPTALAAEISPAPLTREAAAAPEACERLEQPGIPQHGIEGRRGTTPLRRSRFEML